MWAAYIINRDYLAHSEDPMAEYDPRQEKAVLFNALSPRIADTIISYLEMKMWGDASDPEYGYDFIVEGKPTGKVFNSYKVSDYTVSPAPKDYSPAYRMDQVSKLRPLSEVVTYSRSEDLRKAFDPILISISEDSEEAAEIIEAFRPEYENMLIQIDAGPNFQPVGEEASNEEYDVEHIEVNSTGGDIENDTRKTDPQQGGEDNAEEPRNAEAGEQANAEGEGGQEGSDEPQQVSGEGLNPEPWDPEADLQAPAKEKPVMPPKPAPSSIVGKLQAIGKN